MRYFGPGARFEKNGNRMRKTRLIVLSALTLALLLVGAHAGEKPSVPRLGILLPESGRAESQVIRGLKQGVKELGYKERETILIEVRDAKGDRNTLAKEASGLVGQKVQIILTTGTRAAAAAKAATREIPIIFVHPADPTSLGLVQSLKRPGGNITGIAAFAAQKTEKRMELLKEILPQVRRIVIFYDSNNPYSRENFVSAQKAAAKLRLEVAAYPVKSSEELKKSVDALQKREEDALFHVADDLVEGEADFIFGTARQKALPTMFNEEIWAIKGALAGYGPSYYEMGRQAARLADKILKGAKAQELPVEAASKFDLVINLRTARALGLDLPKEILKKADKVIR